MIDKKPANPRDLFLDLLKGLGCLLMIMAHMPFKSGFYKHLTFLGGFAPILFFAVSGITAAFQARKYKPYPVIFNYVLLFFLGFSLNGFHSPDFLHPPAIHFDMISVIALCSTLVYLLEYYLGPPRWLYLLLGILSFLIKLGFDILLPVSAHPRLAGILLPHVGTFPLIPWLFVFFLGVFAYHANDLSNTGAALLALTLFFIPGFFGDIPDYRNKFDMSKGYFLLSCFLLFIMFSVVRRMTSMYPPSPKNPLVFLGRNSLLFLYVHFAVIAVLSARLHLQDKVGLFRHYPVMFWLFILSVSLLVMISCLYAAGWVPIKNHFDGIWMWLLLVVLVWLVPVMIEKEGFVRWLEAGFGILTGIYYHRLRFAILSRDS